jgi:50S ribosomal protein L16 3-hydroxylase
VHAALSRARPAPVDTERFLLRNLTEPKPQVVFDRPARPLGLGQFTSRARIQGFELDRRTRMLYSARAVGINGESVAGGAGLDALRRLADRRALSPRDRVPAALWPTLHAWYLAGWINLQKGTGAQP